MIIRAATPADVPQMTALQNAIIAAGGTTAHQTPKTEDSVLQSYVTGAQVISCVVAVHDARIIGFQSIGQHPDLPQGWGDIGTFVQLGLQAKGTGAQLFAASKSAARKAGLTTLNATIRADNLPGLAYYARIGFSDYAHDPDWALADGTKVGRISRRFEVTD